MPAGAHRCHHLTHDHAKGGHRLYPVSAVSRSRRRSPGRLNPDPTEVVISSADRLTLACDLRDTWLSHSLAARPADRVNAEAAVGELYALIGEPPPRFEWVPSPTAALTVLHGLPYQRPSTMVRATRMPALFAEWPVPARLATLASTMREALDARAGSRPPSWAPLRPALVTARNSSPQQALRERIPFDTVYEAAVCEPLAASLRDCVVPLLRAGTLPGDNLPLTWYGQHDAYWIADHEIRARINAVRYRSRDLRRLEPWAALARSTGWWWPGDGWCVMAERPVEVHTEPLPGSIHGAVRLHRDDGPAVRFADGAAVHVLHGTGVPEWVFTDPTVERIHAEANVEVRRSAIERIGWDAYVARAGLRHLAVAPDPGNRAAELHLYETPPQTWGRPARLLLVVNGSVEPDGTHRRYGLGVPAHFDDPVAAAGWCYGLSGEMYRHLARRT